ncbi:hypothetical protein HYV82_06605 [Candidatus Woesearchaeota archaeon]|nr:hypothetical protein [Candidatus Woesearchaeota archaeon]
MQNLYKGKIYLIFAAFLLSTYIAAASSVSDTFYETDEKTFTIDGNNYTVRLEVAINAGSLFTHNNEKTGVIPEGGKYTFSDGLQVTMDKQIPLQWGYKSQVTLIKLNMCGDGICSSTENCNSDKCCNGETKDLNSDAGNCGACGIRCANGRNCVNGVCISPPPAFYCGDGVCDTNENSASCQADCPEPAHVCGDDVCYDDEKDCCRDCGCDLGHNCVSNKCVPVDECLSDEGCKDNNPCTIDKCLGMPKKCVNTINASCEEIGLREKQATVQLAKNVSVPASGKANASAGAVSSERQAAERTLPAKTIASKKPIFTKVIDWFKGLFK